MSLVGFKAQNHRQQVGRRGANPRVDDRATAPEVFGPLHDRFGFTLDVAAQPHNAKLPRYYTPDQDGLEQSWAGERVWCNPPYSSIEPWIVKAWTSCAELVVMLLPANRCEQTWWQRWVEPFRDGNGTRPGELSIPLTNSKQRILIDEDDAPLVLERKWRLDSTGYAVCSLPRVDGKNRNMHLHRLLAGLTPGDGFQCDHVNRNRLDNRRANLRVVTAEQNGRNRTLYSNNTSGFKGVSFDKKADKWEASIKVDYRKQFIGYFDTAEEAAAAYDAVALRVHGVFASPNGDHDVFDRPGGVRVEFLPGRMRFIAADATEIKPNERPPFGVCLLIWGTP